MTITQCSLAHVGELDVALGARVHEDVALAGVELCGGDHLGQLLHVGGFNVDDVYREISTYRGHTTPLYALNDWSEMFKFQRLTRRSSAEI